MGQAFEAQAKRAFNGNYRRVFPARAAPGFGPDREGDLDGGLDLGLGADLDFTCAADAGLARAADLDL